MKIYEAVQKKSVFICMIGSVLLLLLSGVQSYRIGQYQGKIQEMLIENTQMTEQMSMKYDAAETQVISNTLKHWDKASQYNQTILETKAKELQVQSALINEIEQYTSYTYLIQKAISREKAFPIQMEFLNEGDQIAGLEHTQVIELKKHLPELKGQYGYMIALFIAKDVTYSYINGYQYNEEENSYSVQSLFVNVDTQQLIEQRDIQNAIISKSPSGGAILEMGDDEYTFRLRDLNQGTTMNIPTDKSIPLFTPLDWTQDESKLVGINDNREVQILDFENRTSQSFMIQGTSPLWYAEDTCLLTLEEKVDEGKTYCSLMQIHIDGSEAIEEVMPLKKMGTIQWLVPNETILYKEYDRSQEENSEPYRMYLIDLKTKQLKEITTKTYFATTNDTISFLTLSDPYGYTYDGVQTVNAKGEIIAKQKFQHPVVLNNYIQDASGFNILQLNTQQMVYIGNVSDHFEPMNYLYKREMPNWEQTLLIKTIYGLQVAYTPDFKKVVLESDLRLIVFDDYDFLKFIKLAN